MGGSDKNTKPVEINSSENDLLEKLFYDYDSDIYSNEEVDWGEPVGREEW